ncbi:hypothetical protein PTKIN_Ptkin11bG0057700 [Pterospermum kingtungense]
MLANSLLSKHGHANKALKVFEEMQRQNVEIGDITFISVLSACTHSGLVDEGEKYFDIMAKDHYICPTMQFYSCLFNLYSQARTLKKAMDIVNKMPFPGGATVWQTLFARCHVLCN